MVKLNDDNVISMIPAHGGFIYISKDNVSDDGEKYIVSYHYCSFEEKKIMKITRSAYLKEKFGYLYNKFAEQLKDIINYKCIELDEDRLFTVYPTGNAYIFAKDGRLLWDGKLLYKDSGPSDAVCIGKSVWVSFAEGDTILRFNAKSMVEELRIGSKKDSAFSKPTGLWADGTDLIVCNAEGKCIERVNTESYVVEHYAEFDEPVYQYLKVGCHEIVLLESGIYRL